MAPEPSDAVPTTAAAWPDSRRAATASSARPASAPKSSPPDVWASARMMITESSTPSTSIRSPAQARLRRLPPGIRPPVTSSGTPGSTGMADARRSTSTPDPSAMLRRWPRRPKPVMSVAPVAPASSARVAASRLSRIMDATAAATTSSGALPAFMAVATMPAPRAFVSTRLSPGRRPALVRMRSGWTSPTMASPNLGSGSSTVWPPTVIHPPSAAASAAPCRTSRRISLFSSSVFHPTRFRPRIGRPPMA